jgi:uncharacterized protein (TIGR00369 family)
MRLHFEQLAYSAERELARRLRASRPAKLFGFTLEAAEPGRALLKMRVRPRHIQMHGVVHGGILAALADTAGAMGLYLMLPRGTRLATLDLNISFLEPAQDGTLLAEGRLLRMGNNFAVAECEIRDTQRRLISKALITYSISPARRARQPRRRPAP